MGLCINYDLRAHTFSYKRAKQIVEKLHGKTLDLAFKEVSEIVELSGDVCNADHFNPDSDLRNMIFQAERTVLRGDQCHVVQPEKIIAFSAWPGLGSEPAHFGLAIYPATIFVLGKSVRTGIKGWCWSSSCHTHHASEDEFGGIPNFIRSHLNIVKVLDFAAEIEVLGSVLDETGYWTNRSMEALGKSPGKWNRQMEKMSEDIRKLMDEDDSGDSPS